MSEARLGQLAPFFCKVLMVFSSAKILIKGFFRTISQIPKFTLVLFGVLGIFTFTALYFRYVSLKPGGSGLPVDHGTYQQILKTERISPYREGTVLKDSLRLFDIDADLDLDVLGFAHSPSSTGADYIFKTWIRDELGYKSVTETYSFRKHFHDANHLPCRVYSLSFQSVTISCGEPGREYLTSLKYQDIYTGYYRDIDNQAISYKKNDGWLRYISGSGGVDFQYPKDIQISEQIYSIFGNQANVIIGSRGSKKIFEINTEYTDEDGGGSLLSMDEERKFLKLSDDSYLSRNWTASSLRPFPFQYVFYEKTSLDSKNSDGKIFASTEAKNIQNGNTYTLFSPLTSESELAEVDTIFSSIVYTDVVVAPTSEAISPTINTVSLDNYVKLQVPGKIKEQVYTSANKDVIMGKNLDISYISSGIYLPSNLTIELLPYGPYGNLKKNNETLVPYQFGFDPVAFECYWYSKEEPPKKIGNVYACENSSGDAGMFWKSYLVIDPNKKYLLEVSIDASATYQLKSIHPNLEDIVKSVEFVK